MLRPDKRPRPMVLRMNVDDCLEVRFQNLLVPTAVGVQRQHRQPAISRASAAASTVYTPNQNALILQDSQTTFDGSPGSRPTRLAGVHVMGLELVEAEIAARDGGRRGRRRTGRGSAPTTSRRRIRCCGPAAWSAPGSGSTYTFIAKAEGAYLLYSTAGERRRLLSASAGS